MTDHHAGAARPGMLSLEELRLAIDAGEIDTVILAFTDMQGRLQGKRLGGEFFLDEVLEHYSEGCNYLLAVDTDMNTVDGYQMSSWARGYGDFVMKPDLATLRRIPWHPATALVLADLTWLDGTPVVASPRQILQQQLARLAERGLVALAGTELEFIVFDDTYEQAWAKNYTGLAPANDYNVDYSILGTSRIEPLLRSVRNGMTGAGPVRGVGQGRVQPRPARDRLPVRRRAHHLRQPLDLQDRGEGDRGPGGMSITFMAKPNSREGNSCHIHLSLRGRPATAAARCWPATARTACQSWASTSWPASWPRSASSRSATRPTSTPTSGTCRAASRRPRCAGAWTTGPARCGWSGTASRCGRRTGRRAGTSTPTSRWRR